MLLGAVVAAFINSISADHAGAVDRLIDDIGEGRHVAQPRVSYRLQGDRHGLDLSCHRLLGDGAVADMELEIDRHGSPLPQILGAVYAMTCLQAVDRARATDVIRRAQQWRGAIGPVLIADLADVAGGTRPTNRSATGQTAGCWAFELLGLDPWERLTYASVQRCFRARLREAHPDSGADPAVAAGRIDELGEARRVVLLRIDHDAITRGPSH